MFYEAATRDWYPRKPGPVPKGTSFDRYGKPVGTQPAGGYAPRI